MEILFTQPPLRNVFYADAAAAMKNKFLKQQKNSKYSNCFKDFTLSIDYATIEWRNTKNNCINKQKTNQLSVDTSKQFMHIIGNGGETS